jgi:folylpolyglutamate synthase/dihydropteroate synthase
MEVFIAREVEVLILEVGLGGRLDAVNAYDPDCAVVTSVALDHTDWLGPTARAIGFEKAGIFRAGRPAFCADPDPPHRCWRTRRRWAPTCTCWAAISAISETGCNGPSGGAAACGVVAWRIRHCVAPGQLRNAAVALAVVDLRWTAAAGRCRRCGAG